MIEVQHGLEETAEDRSPRQGNGNAIHAALSSSCPSGELFRVTLAKLRGERFIDPRKASAPYALG